MPLGPRADCASRSSRTPSRRPTRSPTPRSPTTPRSCATSSATCCSRSTSSRSSSRSRETGDLDDVARGVHDKLVRRHPHVFGDAEARTAGPRARPVGGDQDRAGGPPGRLPRRSGIASRALLLARKVQRRAAAVGYDWPVARRAGGEGAGGARRAGRGARAGGAARARDRAGPRGRGGARRSALHGRQPRPLRQRRSRAGAPGATARFRERVELRRELAAEAGEDWAELDLDGQERWYERAKTALERSGAA